ncbi:hypothetical protein CONPUDRAFT_156497 [Coniophora puteana RWD-64-598 SS2]|uniref:Uncharacterized protein n=1 Tax=Coniophora puteana (strain RWD-64-598) TaxID=741705 RepID=A0A5M3MIP5_CONPW|nr:uncharacterized protein CONPUDRAFT_156497 [Coniophora puteana RWD-64-598 SS2]EIW78515.1 hypothetical protein CONPUDRAFT_156497 [Coniophora puteana RWD-64-598 SS2]
MSTAFVVGLFSLVNGDRRAEQNGSTQTFYCFYETAFRYSNGSDASPAQLRVYSPLGGLTLPDDTLAFVVAKAYFDREGPILLDAQPQQFYAFPGDPSEEAYYDHVPEFDFPLLFAVGRVNAPSTIDSLLPPLQRFDIAVSEYVRNTVQHSKAEMVFNSSTSRWSHTPTPAVNSSVGVLGMSAAKTSDGYIQFELLSLALNVANNVSVGGSGSLAARTVTVNPAANTPSKKDRFSARVSGTKSATVNEVPDLEPTNRSREKKKVVTEEHDVGGGRNTPSASTSRLPPEAYHPQTPGLYESEATSTATSTSESILAQLEPEQLRAMVAMLPPKTGDSENRRSPSPAGRGKRPRKSKK